MKKTIELDARDGLLIRQAAQRIAAAELTMGQAAITMKDARGLYETWVLQALGDRGIPGAETMAVSSECRSDGTVSITYEVADPEPAPAKRAKKPR